MERGADAGGVTPVQGVILMVAVTVVLAAIVLAALFWLPHLCDPFPPTVFRVLAVHHQNEAGTALNYDSRVLMENAGSERYLNGDLAARFYADDVPLNCVVETLHGADFVPTHHNGVERMQGQGCSGLHWDPGERILVDLRDGSYRPGQVARLDIVDKNEGCVVSRCWFRC
jgi:hypothetical protein